MSPGWDKRSELWGEWKEFLQSGVEILAISAADGDLCAIGQEEFILPLTPGAEFFDPMNVHDDVTMDAAEIAWVKICFHGFHRLTQEMLATVGMQDHVVSARFHPMDCVGRHENRAIPITNHNP